MHMNRGIVAVCSFIRPSYYNQVGVVLIAHKAISNNCHKVRMMGTRYQIISCANDQQKKWIQISFDELDDTTTSPQKKRHNADYKLPTTVDHQVAPLRIHEKMIDDATTPANELSSLHQTIPESVLQYQRQMRKIQAADRAGKTNVNIDDHLRTVYVDDHIVVTNKPSGILCVPGVNNNKSLLDLVFTVYGNANPASTADSAASDAETAAHVACTKQLSLFPRDSMIVHRLDMDTSGIVIFARNRASMAKLHEAFRDRTGAKKIYEALLVGWLDIDRWIESSVKKRCDEAENTFNTSEAVIDVDAVSLLNGGEIRLPLQRDHKHPPFMRVSTPESEAEAQQAVTDLNHAGYSKLMAKKPKSSITQFRILSHEMWNGFPVTRVSLTPITGRTHQLRVHCAAMGHPILGDPAYGFCGEAHPNGGFSDIDICKLSPTCASFELRRDVEDAVRENGRTMCLHARKLTLNHPVTNMEVVFEAEPSF